MNTTTKMTLGILGGMCAGFCIGLLTSPDKGSKNRKKVMETASGWAHKLTHMFSGDGTVQHKAITSNGTTKVRSAKPKRTPKR